MDSVGTTMYSADQNSFIASEHFRMHLPVSGGPLHQSSPAASLDTVLTQPNLEVSIVSPQSELQNVSPPQSIYNIPDLDTEMRRSNSTFLPSVSSAPPTVINTAKTSPIPTPAPERPSQYALCQQQQQQTQQRQRQRHHDIMSTSPSPPEENIATNDRTLCEASLALPAVHWPVVVAVEDMEEVHQECDHSDDDDDDAPGSPSSSKHQSMAVVEKNARELSHRAPNKCEASSELCSSCGAETTTPLCGTLPAASATSSSPLLFSQAPVSGVAVSSTSVCNAGTGTWAAAVDQDTADSSFAKGSCSLHMSSSGANVLGTTGGGGGVRDSSTVLLVPPAPRMYAAPPRTGRFTDLISFLLSRGAGSHADAPTDALSSSETEQLRQFLSLAVMKELCEAATEVLAAEPNVLNISVAESDTLVVVGDIHGQFSDLYRHVLSQQMCTEDCNPSGIDKHFLFLGDFVDRGPNSTEVIMLILALKVEYPQLIFITRGNHEESKTSSVYGFLVEMECRMPSDGAEAWRLINDVFCYLPLSALVTTPHMRFFATHGGLTPAIEDGIETIEAVKRHEFCRTMKGTHEDIVNGLLWSDPTNDIGTYSRNPRGCGVLFGPAASEMFCKKNNVDFICRAHQVVMDGYCWRHRNKVVTLFSAPNYCGINDNLGAVMVVDGTALKPSFVQYDAEEEDEEDWNPVPNMNFAYASCFA